MRESYDWHSEMAPEFTIPAGVSLHEACMYGVLSSFFEMQGASPAATAEFGYVIWLDLLPFLYLPPEEGLTALTEYIIWKEHGLEDGVEKKDLLRWVHEGTVKAAEDGREEDLRYAEKLDGLGPLPWLKLLAESLRKTGI